MQKKSNLIVLYLEDDSVVKDHLADTIKPRLRANDQLLITNKQSKAIDILKGQTVDVLIIGIENPSEDCVDFIRVVKSHRQDIPIYGISSCTDSQLVKDAKAAGITACFSRDEDIQKLINAVREQKKQAIKNKEAEIMSPEEYQEIVDSTALVSKTDSLGRITYVNDLFCWVAQYTREELIGKPHNIVRHPDMPREAFQDMWNTISIKKKAWTGEVKNRKKNGEPYYVEARIYPKLDEHGEVKEYVAIRYDVTELALQKEETEKQKTLNRFILDEQTNIVAVTTREEGIVTINKAFFDIFPYKDVEDFKSKHACICDLFVECGEECTIAENPQQWFEEIITSENPESKKHRVSMVDKHGQKRIFSATIKVATSGNKDERRKYFVASLSDITEAENEAESARKESFAKSNFLATMSHEIRTPMNGIMGFVDILAGTNLAAQQKEYIGIIQNSANSLLGIINDILDFSKIETGNFTIENIDFDPMKEIEGVADLFVAKATEKNIDLCVFVDPTLPSCTLGDPFRIKQILSNLINNAIKFTPDKGEVSVIVEKTMQTNSLVSLRICVKDTGTGMSEGTKKIIFSPFMQADTSISRNYGGTGLGLTICQSLAELMGSQIEFESELGVGSKFWFMLDLPICNEKNHVIDKMDIEKKDISIYVAEESQSRCLYTLQRYLESFGFNYSVLQEPKGPEFDNCHTLIVITSGKNNVPEIDDNYFNSHRVVSVVPANTMDYNRFSSHSTISMPINGSKIFDSLVEGRVSKIENIYEIKDGEDVFQYDAKVMVAEDNKINQRLAMAMLQRFGITPIVVENGAEALLEYKKSYESKEPFDLIFMDIHMPIMNGMEATAEIISFEEDLYLKHVPIIALTADAIKGKEEEYLNVGMDSFLSKPIDKAKFNDKIMGYLKHCVSEEKNEAESLVLKEASQTPVNDENSIMTLKASIVSEELGLDMDIALDLVQNFYENVEVQIKDLGEAIKEHNHEVTRSISHSIKGAAGSLRLDDIYELCKEIEENSKAHVESYQYREKYMKLKTKIFGKNDDE